MSTSSTWAGSPAHDDAGTPSRATGMPERLVVRVVDRPDALFDHRDDLEALAGDLAEPNVFYEPWFFFPLIRHLPPEQAVRFVLIFDRHAPDRRLCAFFPLVEERLHPRLPLRCLRLWQGVACFRTIPLIRTGCLDDSLRALVAWLDQPEQRGRVLELPRIPADGAVRAALERVRETCPRLRVATLVTHGAMLVRELNYARFLERRAFSRRSREKLKKQARDLAKLGEVRYRRGAGDHEVARLSEAFLALESSGWKGARGTALASTPATRAFFEEIVTAAHARGRLDVMTLHLDRRLVAAQVVLAAPPAGFAFKVAYDERYAKYSPGVMLAIEHVRRLHDSDGSDGPELDWVDSCASPNSLAWSRIWQASREVHEIKLALGFGSAALLVASWPAARALYRKLRWHDAEG